jgi:uncharacterized protein (DUF2147 family)
MKKLYLIAALMLATTSAYAGNSISFEINGKKVRIEAPRNCAELACIKISAPGLTAADFGLKGTKFGSNDDDDDAAQPSDPAAPASAPAPAGQAAAAPATVAPSAVAATPSTAVAPSTTSPAPAAAAVQPAAPAIEQAAAPSAAPVAAPAAPQQVATAAAVPTPAPATPLGVWSTEEHKGMVRIEPCGQNAQNLCGFAVNSGEKILINMKPAARKWTGRIHDPDSGRNYDSTIAMKGPNALKVQGCAFGGLFCGGQTWTRIS